MNHPGIWEILVSKARIICFLGSKIIRIRIPKYIIKKYLFTPVILS